MNLKELQYKMIITNPTIGFWRKVYASVRYAFYKATQDTK